MTEPWTPIQLPSGAWTIKQGARYVVAGEMNEEDAKLACEAVNATQRTQIVYHGDPEAMRQAIEQPWDANIVLLEQERAHD